MDDSYSFHTETSTRTKQGVDNDYIHASIFCLKNISIAYGLLSIGCTPCGILTVYYASSILTWPFSSASGIWTGLMALVIFFIGFRTFKTFDVYDPGSSKCLVVTFYTLVIICITLGTLHLAYSAVGFSYCSEGYVLRHKDPCFTDEKGRITLMEGFNMMFGSLLILLSVFTTIYMSIRRRLRTLTGTLPLDQQPVVNA